MLGDDQTIIFLCIVLLSLPLGVGFPPGAGLVHLSHAWQTPTHKGTPASDVMRRSQLWCRTCEFLCWSFTSYEGTSVTIWCTTLWGLSSHLSLIFLFPWKASALTRMRSPLLCLSLCHRLGLGPLKSGLQTVSNSGYISIHMLGGGASSGTSVLLKVGK